MLKFWLFFTFSFLSLFYLKLPAQAITSCGKTPQQLKTQLSFSCFGTLESSGKIDSYYNSDIGYDLGRQWQAGMNLTQILKLGDLADEFAPQNFTITQLITAGGGNLSQVLIKDFPLIAEQSLSSLVQTIPSLNNVKISLFPGLSSFNQNLSLKQLLKDHPSLKKRTLNQLGIGDFSLSAIPGLGQAKLGNFSGWANQFISNIPYLASIPLAQMPSSWLASNPVLARLDALRSREGQQTRTITGSYQEGFNVPCSSNCDYIELDDVENAGQSVSLPTEGVRWISGKKQKVKGGSGCLAWLNGGKEPTGTHPFGSAFKVVLWDVNPPTEQVTTKLFFRIKASCGLLGSGASPYFIGPVSWLTHKTNDLVFTGLISVNQTLAVPPQIPISQGTIPSSNNPPINSTIALNPQPISPPSQTWLSSSNKSNNKSNNSFPSAPVPIATLPQNQDFSWSSWQFSQVLPQNNYQVASELLCTHQKILERNVPQCGYYLGMFGLGTQDPLVIAMLNQTQASQKWLKAVNSGSTPTPTQIQQFLGKTLQQQILEQKLNFLADSVKQEIDPLTAKPFDGQRKIQRVAQTYYGGTAALIDADIPTSITGNSLKKASRNWVELYQSRG